MSEKSWDYGDEFRPEDYYPDEDWGDAPDEEELDDWEEDLD